ncbi:MAG: urea transporter [Candidatus Obscuribacterales bacterium]
MQNTFAKILGGYGSFFGLHHPLSRLLLLACTMLHPATGISGLECAALVLVTRKMLSFPAGGEIEIVNGLLFGMLIGSLYQPSLASLTVLAIGAVLIVLATVCLSDTLGKAWRLPVLGLPYVLTSYLMLPIASHLGMAPLTIPPIAPLAMPLLGQSHLYNNLEFSLDWLPWLVAPTGESVLNLFAPLGSLYFNGTPLGGLIVFIAFAISSRYLAVLALAASITCTVFLQLFWSTIYPGAYNGSISSSLSSALSSTLSSTTGNFHPSILAVTALPILIAQMNGVLTAGIIGGLYTVPSIRSIAVALGSALLACLLTLFLENTFWSNSFPPLALPFVLSTYIVLIGLSSARGGPWLKFWLITPALPEQSLERLTIARARGLDLHSVALRSPVSGTWKIYQGVDGEYTHKNQWRYALDLIQTENDRSYKESGTLLSDYFSYGKAVLSPGWGTVVSLVNNCSDNQPGAVDLLNNWGNYIIVQLDNGPYVMLAHLQRGSVRVNAHSRVAPGQLLALCGNSGRSPQPHLHIHVQTQPEIGSSTVPFHFCHVLVTAQDGGTTYQLNASPKENERIKAPARNAALARALNMNVGRCFEYSVSQGSAINLTREKLTVALDLNGQFSLELRPGNQAKTNFTASEDLIAFFGRNNKPSNFLDTFVLAVGLTPLAEGNLQWQDKVPVRLLPIPWVVKRLWAMLHPFSPCLDSEYTRTWNSKEMIWIQTATHNLQLFCFNYSYRTEARISELSGLLSIESFDNKGQRLLKATLDGVGIREDNGIPEISFEASRSFS